MSPARSAATPNAAILALALFLFFLLQWLEHCNFILAMPMCRPDPSRVELMWRLGGWSFEIGGHRLALRQFDNSWSRPFLQSNARSLFSAPAKMPPADQQGSRRLLRIPTLACAALHAHGYSA